MRTSRGLGPFLLLAQLGTAGVAIAATTAETTTPETTKAATPAPAVAAPPAPRPSTPFRLALTYTRVLREDGDLANDALSTNALGLQFVSPSSTYVRDHFSIGHQWESAGSYRARGFRIDLVSFGYPIRLVDSGGVRLDLEPIVTALRGEIMFVSDGGGRFVRLESGLGVELAVTYRRWFFAAQPLAIDFRYWFYGSKQFQPQSQTGLGRIFPMRLALGHEF